MYHQRFLTSHITLVYSPLYHKQIKIETFLFYHITYSFCVFSRVLDPVGYFFKTKPEISKKTQVKIRKNRHVIW